MSTFYRREIHGNFTSTPMTLLTKAGQPDPSLAETSALQALRRLQPPPCCPPAAPTAPQAPWTTVFSVGCLYPCYLLTSSVFPSEILQKKQCFSHAM